MLKAVVIHLHSLKWEKQNQNMTQAKFKNGTTSSFVDTKYLTDLKSNRFQNCHVTVIEAASVT